ncbi:hypothetical protein OHA72_43735 [Dactylosporangium sp. NBC_01737]|uniref:hypothetical protein n=1 Tax=Dactylosporangium sp. NBC_01737 TaxID=2975959 RepID=UPI002E0DD633|nr:hypothetical protein OHA72_43735 [Dactylosporangium sp. NBC_01737]
MSRHLRPSDATPRPPWWQRWPDALRISGIALVLFFAHLVVPTIPGSLVDPVLEYREDGYAVTVKPGDGCLIFHRDTSSRGGDEILPYCPARIPDGANGWAPQLRDFYTVDPATRLVTELVQFGVVPDQVTRVRSTLPGGQIVETPTRRVDGVAHPVVALHLRNTAFPVDLTETGGRRVFVRLELFDAGGRAVPVV